MRIPIYRWRHTSWKQHLLGWLQGFAELLDGCVTLCSLGFLGSGFEMAVARYRAGQYFKEMKARKK